MIGDAGREIILEIESGVAQEHDVSRRWSSPVMVGIAQKVLHRLGRRLPEAEFGVDVFHRNGLHAQALASPELEKRPDRRQKRLRSDDEIVSPVAFPRELGARDFLDHGPQHRARAHRPITPARFRSKPQSAVFTHLGAAQPLR